MIQPSGQNRQSENELPALPIEATLWEVVATSLGLAPKLTEIVELLLRGLDNKAIIREMGISESTRQTYFERIAMKTGAHGRTAIILLAFRLSHQLRAEPGVVQNHDIVGTDNGNTDFRPAPEIPIVNLLVQNSIEERKCARFHGGPAS